MPPPPPPGYPQQYPMAPGAMPGMEASGATASMVLGIISCAILPFACFCWFLEIIGLPLGIVAVVLAFRARGKIAQSQGTLGGGGKALAGMITGFVGVGLAVLVFILAIIGLATLSFISNSIPSPSP